MPAVIPSKTKRTSRRLTVAEREKAAKYKIETGVTYAQLSKWLEEQIGIKVPASTLSGHLKDYKDGKFQQKDGQAMFIDGSCHNIKDGEYTLLETFLYKWIRKSDGSVPLTGDIVRQKALEYIGIFYPHKKDKFMASNHWLHNFFQRYGIKSFRTSGERKSADREAAQSAIPELHETLKNYEPCEIYNMDETGLMYNAQVRRVYAPDPRLHGTVEDVTAGSKEDKRRLTYIICSNADGSHKVKCWVIGTFERPRCFKEINYKPDRLGIEYRANKKAWMTAHLFDQYLAWFNRTMIARDRKAVLLVDNCPAHKTLIEYSHVKVVFLPANTTSIMQPCDQGIIRAFKARYQALRSRRLGEIYKDIRQTNPFDPLSKNETARLSLNVLEAIKCSVRAWESVTKETVENCWKCTGIIPSRLVDNVPENTVGSDSLLPETEQENSRDLSELLEQCPCLAAELDQSDVGPRMCEEPDEQQLVEEVREEFGLDENNEPLEDANVDVVDSEAPVVNARKIVGYLYKALNGASEGSHLIKPENQHLYEQFMESARALIRDIDRYSEPPVRIQRSITEFITSNNSIDGDQSAENDDSRDQPADSPMADSSMSARQLLARGTDISGPISSLYYGSVVNINHYGVQSNTANGHRGSNSDGSNAFC